MSRWAGARRAGVVIAAGAVLTTAAAQLPGTVQLGAVAAAVGAPSAEEHVIRAAALVCPGPETEGIAGVPAVPGPGPSVLAASAPAKALPGSPESTAGDGAVTVRALAGQTSLASITTRGATVSAGLTGANAAEVSATGALAPGLAALQTGLRRDGDDRGLQAVACSAPAASAFLLAGGGDSTRRERLVVANPGGNPVTIDVQLYGAKGPVASVNGSRITVPARGRIGLLLDAFAPGERNPAVGVVATGGTVTAVLEDSWIEGATGRGRDDSASAAGPAVEQVVPAAFLDGPALLRILVPGGADAVVQSRVLTSSGPAPLPTDGVVRVPGGTVRDVDLSALPAGAYAVQVRADQPVVAAVQAQRRPAGNGASDLGWVASTAPIATVGGSPLPAGVAADLSLVATRAPASADVVTVGADGAVSSRALTVGADSVSSVEVTGATSVWVRHTEGTLRAGLALRAADRDGPLLSLVGLAPAAVLAATVPVRAVQR